jgi:hypothetical protein
MLLRVLVCLLCHLCLLQMMILTPDFYIYHRHLLLCLSQIAAALTVGMIATTGTACGHMCLQGSGHLTAIGVCCRCAITILSAVGSPCGRLLQMYQPVVSVDSSTWRGTAALVLSSTVECR